MTFWIYSPKDIIKKSTILPKDYSDILNFFSIILILLVAYVKKNIKNDLWKKILVLGSISLLFLSFFSFYFENNKEIKKNIINYDQVLSID